MIHVPCRLHHLHECYDSDRLRSSVLVTIQVPCRLHHLHECDSDRLRNSVLVTIHVPCRLHHLLWSAQVSSCSLTACRFNSRRTLPAILQLMEDSKVWLEDAAQLDQVFPLFQFVVASHLSVTPYVRTATVWGRFWFNLQRVCCILKSVSQEPVHILRRDNNICMHVACVCA